MVKRGGRGGKFAQRGRRKRQQQREIEAAPANGGPAPGRKQRNAKKRLGELGASHRPSTASPHEDSEGEEEGLEIFDDAKPVETGCEKPSRFSDASFTDALSQEVDRFIAAVTANSRQIDEEVSNVLQQVRSCALSLWSDSSTILFGSRATGLSLPSGDIDIGILNVSGDLQSAGAGFKRRDRDRISTLLKRLLNKLRKCKLVKKAQVVRARVPIIKCELVRSGLACDISMGVSNGEKALGLIREKMHEYPKTFGPLVLVVKGILQSWGLGEVYLGGLGSYSLYNMVLAHLLAEQGENNKERGGTSTGTGAGKKDRKQNKSENMPNMEIGCLLVSFLKRFGVTFDYVKEAVSINNGGFIGKRREWVDSKNRSLIAIEDPQDPGRDIGKVSHNISKVQRKFRACYEALSEAQLSANGSRRERRDGGKSENATWPQLGRIMKVELVLKKPSPPTTRNGHTNTNPLTAPSTTSDRGRRRDRGDLYRETAQGPSKRARLAAPTSNRSRSNPTRQVFFQKKTRRVADSPDPDFDEDLFRIPTRKSASASKKKEKDTLSRKQRQRAKSKARVTTPTRSKRKQLSEDVVDDFGFDVGSAKKKNNKKKNAKQKMLDIKSRRIQKGKKKIKKRQERKRKSL